MTTLRTIIAATLIAGTAGAATAQDLTQFDFTAFNNAWNADANAAMNAVTNDIVWANMNNPQVIDMYNYQMQTGQFYGTLEQFAYKYAATGGMTVEGIGNYIGTSVDLDGQFRNMTGAANSHTQVYYDAFGNLVTGYGQHQKDQGSALINGW